MDQHYVSRCYLQNFTSRPTGPKRTPAVWVADLRTKTFWERAPRNLANRPNYYAVTRDDGTKDHSLEHFMTSLETAAAPVLRAVRQGRYDLCDKELIDLLGLACMHFARVPAMRDIYDLRRFERAQERMADLASDKSRLENAIKGAFPGREISPDQVEGVWRMIHTPESFTMSLNPEASLNDVIAIHNRAVNEFQHMRWQLLIAEYGEFITGDRPVSMLSFDDADTVRKLLLRAPRTQIAFPVCPQVCLFGTWRQRAPRVASVSPSRLVDINRQTRWFAQEQCYSATRAGAKWAIEYVP
jgi:hypothetical protein